VLLKDDGVNATNLEITNIKANDGTAAGSIADSTGVVTVLSSILTTADINGGTADGVIIGGTTPAAATVTNLIANTDLIIAGTTTITAILDEDNMASDSATALATQQSIKAYVDAQVGTVDTLAEILAIGNTTGGTDLAVSTGDDITFADSSKAIFGAGSDLQIYHDGTSNSSYIKETGTGSFNIEATNLFLKREGGTESFIDCVTNGAVTAYYDGSAKLATTATGIDVTGTVTADGLGVDGLISTTASQSTDGQIRIRNSTTRASGNKYGIRFADSSFETNASIYAEQLSSGANGADLIFGTNNSTGGIGLTSATERMRIGSSGGLITNPAAGGHAVFNEGGVDADFRVESDTNANALFVEGSSGNVGIGGTPNYKLNVVAAAGAQNIFQAGQSGVSNGLSITSDGSALTYSFLTGNVGIGTSSPDGKLHIQDGSAGVVTAADGADDLVIETSQTSGMSILCGAGWASVIQFGGGTDNNIGNIGVNDTSGIMTIGTAKAGGTMALRTADGVNALTIDASQAATFTPAAGGHAVFNEAGVNADFRVESVNNDHMLFLDASIDRISMGTSDSADGTLTLRSTNNNFAMVQESAATIPSGGIRARMFEGTYAINGNSVNSVLSIPITSQGGLWVQYQVELTVVSGEYNISTTARGGSCIFSFVSLTTIATLSRTASHWKHI
jgi:hypothetical protein